MGSRWPAILTWSICALTLAFVAATAFLVFLNRALIHSLEQANPIEIVLPISFTLLGELAGSAQSWTPSCSRVGA